MAEIEEEDPGTVKKNFVIGPYSIGNKIGQGIFAKVKLGLDGSQRKVAIKIFDKHRFKKKHALLQVEKEINAIRIARHPHIVKYVEVMETKSRVFLVMEHVANGELYDYIQENGKLPEREAARLFYQIVSAVKHSHDKGIIHRDLKPENILLDADNNAKIVDFGLCTHVPVNQFASNDIDDKKRILVTQCGSPHYAAPEILNARPYHGPHVDIWSLGVILFAMLCGKLPFNARDITILHRLITAGRYVIPAYVSDAAGDLIFRILQLKPDQRPSAAEILEDPWFVQHVDEETRALAASYEHEIEQKAKQKSAAQNACRACRLVARSAQSYIALRYEKQSEEKKVECTCGLALESLATAEENAANQFVTNFLGNYFRQQPQERPKVLSAEFKQQRRRFIRGAESGDAKVVQEYVDANHDISVTAMDNWTALHHASRKGHAKIIQILLTSFQPLDIDVRTRNSWTALMMAADRGHKNAVNMLLEYGADPHLVNKNDKSSIFLARESKHRDIAEILTEHSSRKHQRSVTKAALEEELHKVSEKGDLDGLDHLLRLNAAKASAGKEPAVDMKATGCDNWTALHVASRKGRVQIIRKLLPFYEGLVDIPTKTKWTALMMAADKGHLEVIRLLLQAGADPRLASSSGLTPITLAREGNHIAVLGLFQHTLNTRQQGDVKVLEE